MPQQQPPRQADPFGGVPGPAARTQTPQSGLTDADLFAGPANPSDDLFSLIDPAPVAQPSPPPRGTDLMGLFEAPSRPQAPPAADPFTAPARQFGAQAQPPKPVAGNDPFGRPVRQFGGQRSPDLDPFSAPPRPPVAQPQRPQVMGRSATPPGASNARSAFVSGASPPPNAPRNPFAGINPF
jgi:hypothetical protein